MGYVMGKPLIMKVRTSAANATPVYRWFAVVPAGINSYVAKNSANLYGDGSPTIFLLALDKPTGTAWTQGGNYFKVNLPFDGTLAATLATGLVNLSGTLNPGDGALGQLYAGDLHGNVWKMDFTPYGTADWTMSKLSPFLNGTTPLPLYIAKDSSGNPQPITMAPTVVAGPAVGTRYVYVATGKYMELGDKSSTATQSMYAMFDNGTTLADSTTTGAPIISSRARLQAGSITVNGTAGYTVSTPTFKWGRAMSDSDSTQRSGWYADFPVSGEREIGNAKLVGSTIIFGSLIPGSSSAGAACVAGGGGGNEYRVDIDTGNGTATASTVGIMGEPLVANLVTATSTTATDSTGRRLKTTYSQVIQQGSGGLAVGGLQRVDVISGRLSWRQINNYQDLKNAP